jgi:hypothetical protein
MRNILIALIIIIALSCYALDRELDFAATGYIDADVNWATLSLNVQTAGRSVFDESFKCTDRNHGLMVVDTLGTQARRITFFMEITIDQATQLSSLELMINEYLAENVFLTQYNTVSNPDDFDLPYRLKEETKMLYYYSPTGE